MFAPSGLVENVHSGLKLLLRMKLTRAKLFQFMRNIGSQIQFRRGKLLSDNGLLIHLTNRGGKYNKSNYQPPRCDSPVAFEPLTQHPASGKVKICTIADDYYLNRISAYRRFESLHYLTYFGYFEYNLIIDVDGVR